ncbi:MAG: ATPase, T2SS/T4P/T4SS family [Candidatus Omnitrophota bacterium]|nr:ATPase, T2SS/T4P/T4SS family [Candidatus Omnitrophota bacterium]
MTKKELLAIEEKVLEKLAGRINLLQSYDEKENLILEILSGVCSELKKKAVEGKTPVLKTESERKQFVKDFLSYGTVGELFADPDVEDIIINSLHPIYIHHAQKGFVATDKRFESQQELELFIRKLIIFSGRLEMKRIANLELANIEGRVNIVISPLGPQITITKAKVEPMSIINLIEKNTLTFDLAAQLWMYVEGLSVRPANIIISGGPGSGKTTLLNALFSFIPQNERIVAIEDTLELNTFNDESCSRLESDEGLSLADLVKNSLRMRPDRIIIGEVRGEEAKDLMTAVNIGKYCMGTIHASTSREAIIRMQNEPMNVPEILINLVDVFIIMKKFNYKDMVCRVVDELSETGGMEQKTVLLSQLWRFDYEHKKITETSPSTIYRDRLSRATGLSPKEIMDEVKLRSKVLQVLAQRGVNTLKELTVFCRAYNRDSIDVLAKLGLKRQELLPQKDK